MALFSTLFFAKYLRVGEDGPGRGHLCHTDTFLVFEKVNFKKKSTEVRTKKHAKLLSMQIVKILL